MCWYIFNLSGWSSQMNSAGIWFLLSMGNSPSSLNNKTACWKRTWVQQVSRDSQVRKFIPWMASLHRLVMGPQLVSLIGLTTQILKPLWAGSIDLMTAWGFPGGSDSKDSACEHCLQELGYRSNLMSISRWMDKKAVVRIHNGILLSY